MFFWISAGIHFLLATIFFGIYYYYAMPKEKMVQKKRFRKKRPLPKEAAENTVEAHLQDYKRKARKAKNFAMVVTFLLVLESLIAIGRLVLSKGAYSKIEVCVWEDETLGAIVDPVSFMNEVDIGSTDGSKNGQEETSDTVSGESGEQEENNGDASQDGEYGSQDQENQTKENVLGNSEDTIEESGRGNSESSVTEESSSVNTGETENDENNEDSESEESSGQQEVGENNADIVIITEDNGGNDEVMEGDKTGSISYDFSPLRLWGPYEFRDYVTGQDLINIENRVNEYFAKTEYIDMFEEILETINDDYGNYKDIHERVDQFKLERESNPELINASKYFENTKDRLFLYKENRNNNVLEQAAISAEGAVEEEQLGDLERYADYINYDRTGIIIFCHVLGLDLEEYDSGTKGDVKYRIGKLMYKPAVNMVHIIFNDKCYSLCSSYIILGDAFENWSPEQKYAVELPFYYLSVCADLVKIMEPGEARKEVCINAVNAYNIFFESGEANPDNSTYVKYAEDAKEKKKYVEMEYALEIEREQAQKQEEELIQK